MKKPPRRRRISVPRDPLVESRKLMTGAYARADGMIDRGEQRVFRVLWFFLPETSVARSLRFQYIMASTFLSDGARDAMRYGALIAVVRAGGSTVDAALVGVAALLPATFLGLYGGAVADALPKRVALAGVYALQAALCVVVPAVYGTGLNAILFLVLTVNILGQVSGPDEQSIAPLIASDAQLASANSLLSLSSNVGTVFGTALMAPVLLRVLGVRAVFAVAGVMLLLASGRVLRLQPDKPADRPRWRRPDINVFSMIRWLADEPAVGTMVILGVLAGVANVTLQTLAPRYVQSVIGVDPADAVYVFAPSSLGLVLAIAATPLLIRLRGERIAALTGFTLTALSLGLLGLVKYGLPTIVDPINAIRLVSLAGLHPGPELRTASALAVPLGFGMAVATMSVQTFVNRRVPLARQGRTFALQSTLKNGAAIGPLLLMGATAELVGVNAVLVATPFLLVALAFALLRLSERFGGRAPAGNLDVFASFWQGAPRSDP